MFESEERFEDFDPAFVNPQITENDDTSEENVEELNLNLKDFGLEISVTRKTVSHSDHLTLTHLDENF